MRLPYASPASLLIMASVSIAALLALSDFDAEEVAGLADIGDDPATISVIVLQCRACNGGYLLVLSDGMGGEATAFCPADLLATPVPGGAAATVTVQRSAEDPDFLYIEDISVGAADGKD